MAMSRQHEALMAVLDVADWHTTKAKSLDDSDPRLATVHRDAARRIEEAITEAIGADDE